MGALSDAKLIEAKDVKKYYRVRDITKRSTALCRALDGLSLDIKPNESLALVGESGCGKSTLARLLLNLEKPTSGIILFKERNLETLDRRERKEYRALVQAVFQNPFSSLDPRMRIREVISEPLLPVGKLDKKEIEERAADILQKVGLPSSTMNLFPHEFSGGQRQRIAIARALWVDPKLIILDEPVSGLDVSIRAQILNLLKDLGKELSVSYLFISHDLAIVKYMSQRVAVMYLGRIVEVAPTNEILSNPRHPYTKAILQASLPIKLGDKPSESLITGEVPSPINVPPGCSFHPRCRERKDICHTAVPELVAVGQEHFVACEHSSS